MKLHEYFDKTYLINLDSRPDRLEESERECAKYGIQFERFRAFDGQEEVSTLKPSLSGLDGWGWNKPAAGLCLTLTALLEKCRRDGVDSVLIMEDDIQFNPDISYILDEAMKQVPESWESIFFGFWEFPTQAEKVSKNVYLMKEGFSLHCHALKKDIFQFVIDILSALDDPADQKYNKLLFPRAKSFVIKPFLAWQRPSLSTIRGQYIDTRFLRPPELITAEEVKELCAKLYLLDDRLSRYRPVMDHPLPEKLTPQKVRELCVRVFLLEEQLGKYEDYSSEINLSSFSMPKILDICARLYLFESSSAGQQDPFTLRVAGCLQKCLDYVLPPGSKRRGFVNRIYSVLKK